VTSTSLIQYGQVRVIVATDLKEKLSFNHNTNTPNDILIDKNRDNVNLLKLILGN
jgi:hypothetical protein